MDDSRKTTPSLHFVHDDPLLRQVVELSPLGLMLSAERRIQWCNAHFAHMFGYQMGELIGQCLIKLYPTETDYERIGQQGLVQMSESGDYQDERLMLRKDGVIQWFRVHGRALEPESPFRVASWVFEPLKAGEDVKQLTARQREVISAMSRGLTSKQCARELNLSPRTVEKIRTQLRERFGVCNAAALMSRVVGLPH